MRAVFEPSGAEAGAEAVRLSPFRRNARAFRSHSCRHAVARAAFSLIEVVAAVAVFALGMVAVIGLFAPVTKSVSASGDAEAAARVADAVRARLGALPFDTALALIQAPADV